MLDDQNCNQILVPDIRGDVYMLFYKRIESNRRRSKYSIRIIVNENRSKNPQKSKDTNSKKDGASDSSNQ